MEMKKLHDVELKRLQQYEVDVTLDPDTANPQLVLSDDKKQVNDGEEWMDLPDNPERFTLYPYVLTEQSFSSGRFYFEVQAEGKPKWEIGVARMSINRTGRITATPENGYWTISFKNNEFIVNSDPVVHLPVRAEPRKVGVFVDYDEGLVSFYEVEARVHIYSATGCTFTEPLHAILKPGLNNRVIWSGSGDDEEKRRKRVE
ncbi:Zinc finger protein RFP [Merluccius polli]|uniref:Zinc finger protein RFP n=1 Tax=Merluccius polli TaxID=89951 RepID=A0AA47NTS3_MERPO|nr:Zinc finger protein RFP [Merluccius polli]